MKKIALRYGE